MALAYIGLLVICYLFDYNISKKHHIDQKNNKMYLTFQMLFVVFIALVLAFRDETVGPDTQSYLESFKIARYNTYETIFRVDDARSREYLFYALTKFIADITDNQIIFFGVYGLLFSLTYGYIVHKYSDNYMIAYIALLALYMSFIISGMRQVAAMSVLLIAFIFMQKRKLMPFLLCVFIAYFFHNTSIVFLAAYPVARVKFGKVHVIFLFICVIMAYLLPDISEMILYDWLAWDKLENYETYEAELTSSGFIIKLCILAFTLFHYKESVRKNPVNTVLYNMSIIGTGLQAFTVVMSQAFRMSMYFSIFDTILIANVIQDLSMENQLRRRNKIMLYTTIIGLLLVYYFLVAGAVDYRMSIDLS